MASFEIERLVDAPADVAWEIIADVAAYHELTPGLTKIEMLGGEGVGMKRRCYDTRGRSWNEQCPLWDEQERRYTFVVETQAEDYPLPFKKLQGTWQVEERPEGTLMKMRFDYVLRPGLMGLMATLFGNAGARQQSEELLDNWEAKIRERVAVG